MENMIRVLRQEITSIHNSLRHSFFPRNGSESSRSGRNYEQKCFENVQDTCKLEGHSRKGNDIRCRYGDIEIKKAMTPDWGQEKLKFQNGRWTGTFPHLDKVRIPKLPPNLTRHKLAKLKEANALFRDQYIDVDDDSIQKYYRSKGNAYIQVEGYGLYHLGEDPAGIGVPEFKVRQRMRVRVKTHTKTSFSVTCAFQPVNIRELTPSPYSLDDPEKIPNGLKE
ncbi:hypothetical protein DSLPV1_150 [Dishui lake phycodnavirus 1]|uniref:hypothetical protein n=1 Tax=Dishui lake phycodnavirus 1 TaxID=2079134 RepID=UPI000CD683B8|nr:hypothetical protein C5Y57_gp150 [Dishui lake phycodnavirus 1]AUT19121.1 hypothetical protein DSLPV1_150 [Dishui lake phycodnavirus 1]